MTFAPRGPRYRNPLDAPVKPWERKYDDLEYKGRHDRGSKGAEARAVIDADRATLLLANTDPFGLFPVLLAAGVLPLAAPATPARVYAAGRVA